MGGPFGFIMSRVVFKANRCKMHAHEYLAGYSLLLLFTTLALVGSFSCRIENVTQIKPLSFNVVVFVPLPDADYDPAFDQGYSIIPAVELAVDQINRRTDILPPLHLVVTVKDSGCDKASKTAVETVSVLRDLLFTRHGPIGFIGPACSEDSIFVTNTFHQRVNLPVFYSGTTPHLSEHAEATPNAFGMISSADILTDMLIRIAEEKNWNWENIAVLYDESREHFQDTYDAFVRGLNNSHQVGYTRQIADSQIPLGEIVERNIRIAIVFSGKKPARQLACLAGQSTVNFVFPIRQLIFTERTLEDFLGDENAEPSFTEQSEGKKYYCDKETVMRGLNGSILLNQALDSVEPDVMTVSNYTAGQIKQQYKERLSSCGKAMNPSTTLPESFYTYPFYDAMWAFAYGVHIALFGPNPSPTFDAVHNAIENNVSFQGVSGWIDFKDRHHVSNDVIIYQITGSAAVNKGLLNGTTLTYTDETFISDEFRTHNIVLHPSLAALGLLVVVVLFVVTLIIQILMIVYRDTPSVKASSSRLNHFIYLGCYQFTVAIAVNTLRQIVPATNGDVLCNMDVMTSVVACTLIFGVILAKSWRTYRIFNHVFKSRSTYSLHDASLSIFIIIFTSIQVILFIPLLVVSPFQEVTSFIYDSSQWPPVRRLQSVCSIQSVGYITLPLLFLLCIMLATVTLATLNRKVKRKNFRRTKHIIVLVYTLTIMWAIGGTLLVLFYYIEFSLDVIYFFYSFLLTVTVLLCQLLLIIPFLIPVASGHKVDRGVSTQFSDYRRRPSTQMSILSYCRLSLLKLAFRHSSMEPPSKKRSSIQIDAQRRTSLQPNIKVHFHPPLCNISLNTISYNSSSDSHTSLQSGFTIRHSLSLSERHTSHTTLQSISESVEKTSPLDDITDE